MADLDLKKYEGDGGIKVLNRGGEHLYSYGTEELIKHIEGLSGVADGKWFIGNLSKEGGGDSPFSKSHETGVDVDIAIPLKGGKSSANDSNWDNFPKNSRKAFRKISASPESRKWKKWKTTVKEEKELFPALPDFSKEDLKKYTSFSSSGEIDSYKSAQLMKYFVDKGFNLVILDRPLFNNIAYDFEENLKKGTIKENDELLKFVKNHIPNSKRVTGPLLALESHKDHFHFRMEGDGKMGTKEGPKLPKERTAPKPEKGSKKSTFPRGIPNRSNWEDAKNWDRARNEEQLDRRKSFEFPKKMKVGVDQDAFDAIVFQLLFNADIRELFNAWIDKETKFEDITEYIKGFELSTKQKDDVYRKISKYSRSTRTANDFNKTGIEGPPYASIVVIMNFAKHYNKTKKEFDKWLDTHKFISIPQLQEKKGNNQMRITKERLAQIIKEEVEAYKASQLNEVDVDELKDAEAYIKEIADLLKSTYETFFKGAAPAIGTPQTKADTGEPVTDQTAHEDAKGLLLDLLGDAIDEFQEKDTQHEQQLDEDGHDDVPSAVRAMKTMAEDALEMLDALEQMDGSLPTWWTNKMAVSASMLNKMRDYLLVPSMEEEMDEQ